MRSQCAVAGVAALMDIPQRRIHAAFTSQSSQ
jgi:hypothetical protein